MNDKLLTKFILSFLIEKEDYLTLTQEQQTIVFDTCKTIMMAIYNSIKFDNVHPVIMCGDVEAYKVIQKSIRSVSDYLPSVDKITIHLIH
tara:strand:+ start:1953 stop:2222 length:270 start_codon:yes stop_codon:yes gene_type:complete